MKRRWKQKSFVIIFIYFQKPDENYLKKEQRDLTQEMLDTRTEPPKLSQSSCQIILTTAFTYNEFFKSLPLFIFSIIISSYFLKC